MGEVHILTISGQYDQVKRVCQFVAGGARQAGFNEDAVFHVELACDEACTNIIEHAYDAAEEGQIIVSWEIDGDDFKVTIRDSGRNFNPDEVPPPSLVQSSLENDNMDTLRVGGLGMHFMRSLMDEVRYCFDQQHGNMLVMVKKLSKGRAPQ
ncbi:MAG: ATP-binding protein [Anaerolineae bacterium]